MAPTIEQKIRKEARTELYVDKLLPVQVKTLRGGHVRYTNQVGETILIERDELRLARAAVARGVRLLDGKAPGWEKKIVLDALLLYDCEVCVCGQLAHYVRNGMKGGEVSRGDSFGRMLAYLGFEVDDSLRGERPSYFGFDSGQDYGYSALEVEWNRVVSRRLGK